jgi:hypothetical protein
MVLLKRNLEGSRVHSYVAAFTANLQEPYLRPFAFREVLSTCKSKKNFWTASQQHPSGTPAAPQ